MTIGISLFLIAAGAILTFALTNTAIGPLDLYVVGIILMIVGVLGIVLAFVQDHQAKRPVRPVEPRDDPRYVDPRYVDPRSSETRYVDPRQPGARERPDDPRYRDRDVY